jgi:hypothetical protein
MFHDTKTAYNTCECDNRIAIKIDSIKLFDEIKEFFQENVRLEIYKEVPVKSPYYIGNGDNGYELKWYAEKWYKCNVCGCLWEFIYPDFPAKGSVRKFKDGKHQIEE